MPTDLLVYNAIPSFVGDRLGIIPVNVSSVDNISKLQVQADPAGAPGYEVRPSGFIPTKYDRDGEPYFGAIYFELRDDDAAVKVVAADTPTIPALPAHDVNVYVWFEQVMARGCQFVVVDTLNNRYTARLGGSNGTNAKVEIIGNLITEITSESWVLYEIPGAQPPGARLDMGHIRLKLRIHGSLPNAEIFCYWKEGNIVSPGFPMQFKEAYLLLPGGPRFQARFPGRVVDVTRSLYETVKIPVAVDRALLGIGNGEPNFFPQLGQYKFRVRACLPGGQYVEPCLFQHQPSQQIHPHLYATDYVSLLKTNTGDVNTAIAQYVNCLETGDEPATTILDADYYANSGLLMHRNTDKYVDFPAPMDFRWPIEEPYGGVGSLGNVGPDTAARFLGGEGPALYDFLDDQVARVADRMFCGLYFPITTTSGVFQGAIPALPRYTIAWLKNKLGYAPPVGFSINPNGYMGSQGPTAQTFVKNGQDAAKLLNVQPPSQAYLWEKQWQSAETAGYRFFTNVDLAHWGRIMGRSLNAWELAGNPDSFEFSQMLAVAVMWEKSYDGPEDDSNGSELYSMQQPSSTGLGLEQIRDYGWAGTWMARMAASFAPNTVWRDETILWMDQYLAAMANVQLGNGAFMATPYKGSVEASNKEFKYAWSRYATFDNLNVAQTFQQVIAAYGFLEVVLWRDKLAAQTGRGWTYGTAARRAWDVIHTLAWSDGSGTLPDYRFAVRNATEGTDFTSRAQVVDVENGYSSQVHINPVTIRTKVEDPGFQPGNDNNLATQFPLALYFTTGRRLIEAGLLDQPTYDAVLARWKPSGLAAADAQADPENWANLAAYHNTDPSW